MASDTGEDNNVAVELRPHLRDNSSDNVHGAEEISLELVSHQCQSAMTCPKFFNGADYCFACTAKQYVNPTKCMHSLCHRRLAVCDVPTYRVNIKIKLP